MESDGSTWWMSRPLKFIGVPSTDNRRTDNRQPDQILTSTRIPGPFFPQPRLSMAIVRNIHYTSHGSDGVTVIISNTNTRVVNVRPFSGLLIL